MIRRLLTTILLAAAVCVVQAQDNKVHDVRGTATFYGEPSHSLDEAKRFALQQARIAALAECFGTNVTQDVYQRDVVSGRTESTYFNMLNASEVKGEWLADKGEPEYEVVLDSRGCYVVTCIVKGTARRISNQAADFEAYALRNGNEQRFSDTRFRPGDELKLYVRVPVDGYMLAYLAGDDRMVYSLLPYTASGNGNIKLRRDTEYVFFDPAKAQPDFGQPDELVMTIEGNRPSEVNQLYVLFSPEPFVKAKDKSYTADTPRTLASEDFQKWLGDIRRRDPRMSVKTIILSVENQ